MRFIYYFKLYDFKIPFTCSSYHAGLFFFYSLPAEYVQRTSLTHLSCSSIFSIYICTVVLLVLVGKPTVPMKKKNICRQNKRDNCLLLFCLFYFLIRCNDREKEMSRTNLLLLFFFSFENQQLKFFQANKTFFTVVCFLFNL